MGCEVEIEVEVEIGRSRERVNMCGKDVERDERKRESVGVVSRKDRIYRESKSSGSTKGSQSINLPTPK